MTHLLVVGDALLDRDLVGTAERLCPDAPVPVLDVDRELLRPGGAGLAALIAGTRPGLLPTDADRVSLLTGLADDPAGDAVRMLLADRGIEVCDLGAGGSTPEKVRVRASGQSLLRLDRGDGVSLGPADGRVAAVLDAANVVLVADYGRGVTRHPDVRSLVAAARERGVPVVWDPHPLGTEPLPGTTLVTPNQHEARRLCDDELGGRDGHGGLVADIGRARRLRRGWAAGAVAVTRGELGAVAVTGDGAPLVVPPEAALDRIDPCGAGDALAAAAAWHLGAGGLVSDAVHRGVEGAGAFLRRGGAAQLSTDHGVGEVPMDRRSTVPRRDPAAHHCSSPTVVATGGCFDVLHPGHLALLRGARALGDRLVVLVNSDASVRRLKGPDRPVHHERDRVAALRALRDVDEVLLFDEDTPERALRQLRPQVFVKGGDYTAGTLPEAAVMSEWGGAAVTVPYLPGHSTTRILDRRHEERAHVG